MIGRRAVAALGIFTFAGLLGLNVVMASFIGDSYAYGDCFDLCPRDERALVELADAVFVGTVASPGAFERRWDGPSRTRFDVVVHEVLKGAVGARVVVTQVGGTDGWGIRYDVAGEEPLREGARYLFAVRAFDAGFAVIARVGSRILVPDTQDAVIARFRDAAGG